MIGVREFILPFVGGAGGTAYAQPSLEHIYLEGARAQGGLAGFMHPYQSAPRTPANAASTLIALDLALGLGDYYDIGALWSDELASADFYYRLLNAGFRIAGHGRHGQLLRRLSRSAAGIRSHVRAPDRAAHASELDRRDQARPHVLLDRAAAVPDRSRAASPATRSRFRRRRRRRCA